MTLLISKTQGPGDGLWFDQVVVTATNRSGNTTGVGEVVMFDLAQSAGEVDNATPGSSDSDGNNSGYNCYIDPAIGSPSTKHYFYGIALESIANDASGRICVSGRVSANVDGSTGVGAALVPAADGQLDLAAGTADCKVVAIAEEADASNVAMVIFDGIHGFGADIVSG